MWHEEFQTALAGIAGDPFGGRVWAATTPFTVLTAADKPFALHRIGFRDLTANPRGARQLVDVSVYVDSESPIALEMLLPKTTRAILALGEKYHNGKWMTSCKLVSVSEEFPDDVLNGTYRTITFGIVSPAYDVTEEAEES